MRWLRDIVRKNQEQNPEDQIPRSQTQTKELAAKD
jgi:hypothetical protein